MEQRLDVETIAPRTYAAMSRLSGQTSDFGLEPLLLELVRMRASQLNGCAYCLDMHSKDAVALGEEPQRLHVLPAWREAPWYSDRERAALALTEEMTRLAPGGVPASGDRGPQSLPGPAAQFVHRRLLARGVRPLARGAVDPC